MTAVAANTFIICYPSTPRFYRDRASRADLGTASAADAVCLYYRVGASPVTPRLAYLAGNDEGCEEAHASLGADIPGGGSELGAVFIGRFADVVKFSRVGGTEAARRGFAEHGN